MYRPKGEDFDELMRLFRFLSPDAPFVKVLGIGGQPFPQQRARSGVTPTGKRVTHTSREQQARTDLTRTFLSYAFDEPLDGTLLLVALFFRKDQTVVDVDNLIKHLKDAAKGVCWWDDCQVTQEYGRVHMDRENPRTVMALGHVPSNIDRVSHYRPKPKKKGKRHVNSEPETS